MRGKCAAAEKGSKAIEETLVKTGPSDCGTALL